MSTRKLSYEGLDQEEAELGTLAMLAKEQRYAIRTGDGHTWLEWDDESTPVPADPQVEKVFTWFSTFEPFVYAGLNSFFRRADLNVQWPTFLAQQPLTYGLPPAYRSTTIQEWMATGVHVRDLAGRLELGGDRRAAPDRLGWLIAYRDALAFDLRRCAERLVASPDGTRGSNSPIGGARAVLKVWLIEAARLGGWPQDGLNFADFGLMTWGSFKAGNPWGDEWLSPDELMAGFSRSGVERALAVATVAGLRHYAHARDVVTAPAFDLWPRLLAAETVLHAALRGTPLDDAWVEQAVRQQQEAEARRAQEAADAARQDAEKDKLRWQLLDPETRLRYIVGELHPQASRERKSRSVWRDAWNLFVAAWESAGLPEETRPYPDFHALRKAADEAGRRERKKRARGRHVE